MNSNVRLIDVHGEPSLTISSDTVSAAMTTRGNHIAPVNFHFGEKSMNPYSLAPWLPGTHQGIDPLLDVLRGGFWCLPFGAQPDGLAHGEVARGDWEIVEAHDHAVTLHMHAQDIDVDVRKTVSVRDGQHGIELPAGTHVLMSFASANKDPRVFDRADELVLDRDGARNLAFDEGIHFCLGMPLARLEARVGISTLIERAPAFTLAAPPTRYPSHVIRGYETIPVTFGSAPTLAQ
jgi:hypothetical protein